MGLCFCDRDSIFVRGSILFPKQALACWVLIFELRAGTQVSSTAGKRTRPVPGARCPAWDPVPGARCPAGRKSPQRPPVPGARCPAGPRSPQRPARGHGRCRCPVPGRTSVTSTAGSGTRSVPGARPGARSPAPGPAPGAHYVPDARPDLWHLNGRLRDTARARCPCPVPGVGCPAGPK